MTADSSTKVTTIPSGFLSANNVQTYTGTRTNTSVARFDGSGNVKSSAMTIGDDGGVTITGSSAGAILFNDADASNWVKIGAPTTVTTNGYYTFPAAPQTGYMYTTLSAGTNAAISILNGVSKFVFLSSGGIPVTRALGTGLTDDGTSINASGGGGSSVTANGSTTVTNIADNYFIKVNMTGGTAKFTPPTVTTLTDAATIATDASVGTYYRVTLGGNRTLGNPTNPTDGQRSMWEIKQDATGGRTLTADTQFAFGNEITAPSSSLNISTNANSVSFITAVYNSTATKWYVVGNVTGY